MCQACYRSYPRLSIRGCSQYMGVARHGLVFFFLGIKTSWKSGEDLLSPAFRAKAILGTRRLI